MARVLNIDDIIAKDDVGVFIANKYIEWETYRNARVTEWEEVSRYVFATDTTKTRNSKLPWSNKTTIPKLCQIRDNLFANYMSALFPKRKWITWEGDSIEDEEISKKEAIEAYMMWATDTNQFYDEVAKGATDYIDKGNAFFTAVWQDMRNAQNAAGTSQGHTAKPVLRRISPLDIVFDPTAPSFEESHKIIRSYISIGEVSEMLARPTLDEGEREYLEALFVYMRDIRGQALAHDGPVRTKDAIFDIQGYGSFKEYLASNTVEVLTFYGDMYNEETGEFKRDQVIKIVDRHKVMSQIDNPSLLGHAPIFHVGWRINPDNLWAMGPLDNLVGMQYRIDHIENLKADLIDITAVPPLKVSGYVEDFTWGPMERINVGDNGDVAMMIPDTGALQHNTEISILESRMEEMAGSPREAMGFRTPGEKTKYEVQQLENAASRVFQNKITQFERQGIEQALNFMLELARRNVQSATVRVFDTENKLSDFLTVTNSDLTGTGQIKPVAARHFAEQANLVQNLTQFYGSSIGQDPEVRSHFSSVRLAAMTESLFDWEQFDIVEPYVRLTEQQEFQRMQNAGEEDTQAEIDTPAGLSEGDIDEELLEDEETLS